MQTLNTTGGGGTASVHRQQAKIRDHQAQIEQRLNDLQRPALRMGRSPAQVQEEVAAFQDILSKLAGMDSNLLQVGSALASSSPDAVVGALLPKLDDGRLAIIDATKKAGSVAPGAEDLLSKIIATFSVPKDADKKSSTTPQPAVPDQKAATAAGVAERYTASIMNSKPSAIPRFMKSPSLGSRDDRRMDQNQGEGVGSRRPSTDLPAPPAAAAGPPPAVNLVSSAAFTPATPAGGAGVSRIGVGSNVVRNTPWGERIIAAANASRSGTDSTGHISPIETESPTQAGRHRDGSSGRQEGSQFTADSDLCNMESAGMKDHVLVDTSLDCTADSGGKPEEITAINNVIGSTATTATAAPTTNGVASAFAAFRGAQDNNDRSDSNSVENDANSVKNYAGGVKAGRAATAPVNPDATAVTGANGTTLASIMARRRAMAAGTHVAGVADQAAAKFAAVEPVHSALPADTDVSGLKSLHVHVPDSHATTKMSKEVTISPLHPSFASEVLLASPTLQDMPAPVPERSAASDLTVEKTFSTGPRPFADGNGNGNGSVKTTPLTAAPSAARNLPAVPRLQLTPNTNGNIAKASPSPSRLTSTASGPLKYDAKKEPRAIQPEDPPTGFAARAAWYKKEGVSTGNINNVATGVGSFKKLSNAPVVPPIPLKKLEALSTFASEPVAEPVAAPSPASTNSSVAARKLSLDMPRAVSNASVVFKKPSFHLPIAAVNFNTPSRTESASSFVDDTKPVQASNCTKDQLSSALKTEASAEVNNRVSDQNAVEEAPAAVVQEQPVATHMHEAAAAEETAVGTSSTDSLASEADSMPEAVTIEQVIEAPPVVEVEQKPAEVPPPPHPMSPAKASKPVVKPTINEYVATTDIVPETFSMPTANNHNIDNNNINNTNIRNSSSSNSSSNKRSATPSRGGSVQLATIGERIPERQLPQAALAAGSVLAHTGLMGAPARYCMPAMLVQPAPQYTGNRHLLPEDGVSMVSMGGGYSDEDTAGLDSSGKHDRAAYLRNKKKRGVFGVILKAVGITTTVATVGLATVVAICAGAALNSGLDELEHKSHHEEGDKDEGQQAGRSRRVPQLFKRLGRAANKNKARRSTTSHPELPFFPASNNNNPNPHHEALAAGRG